MQANVRTGLTCRYFQPLLRKKETTLLTNSFNFETNTIHKQLMERWLSTFLFYVMFHKLSYCSIVHKLRYAQFVSYYWWWAFIYSSNNNYRLIHKLSTHQMKKNNYMKLKVVSISIFQLSNLWIWEIIGSRWRITLLHSNR